MTKRESSVFQTAAEAFAALALTKRNDVKVLPYAGHDMAIDLLVQILKNRRPTLRFFGAQVVPHLDLPDPKTVEAGVFSHAMIRDPFEDSLPICVFVIGVRKPEGIYRWSVEPVVEDGRAELRHRVVSRQDVMASWHPLDEAGANLLIGQVNDWYDARNGSSAPKSRRRHSKTGS
jgi:hypothetical protein